MSRGFDKENSLGWGRLNFLRHERHLAMISTPVVLAGVMITTDSGPMLFRRHLCLFYTHAQGRRDEREKSDKNKR